MASPPGPKGPFDYSEYRTRRMDFSNAANSDAPTTRSTVFDEPTERVPSSLSESLSLSEGRPPVHWLLAAALGVAVGLVIAVSQGRSALAAVAWLLTGPLALGLLAVYTRADLVQRARFSYRPRTLATALYTAVLVGAAIGVLLSGWHFADWLARR